MNIEPNFPTVMLQTLMATVDLKSDVKIQDNSPTEHNTISTKSPRGYFPELDGIQHIDTYA